MALEDSILLFVVSWLVGAVAIFAGARFVIDRETSLGLAAVTALVGAVVWGLTNVLIGWIPLLGPLVLLIVWIGVLNWRYPGGLGTAAAVGVVAWVVALVITYLLAVVGVISPEALGIPGA